MGKLLKSRKYVHVVLASLIAFSILKMYGPGDKMRYITQVGIALTLVLLSLSLIACSVARLKTFLAISRGTTKQRIKPTEQQQVFLDETECLVRLSGYLVGKGYRVSTSGQEITAVKNSNGLLGSVFFHLGMVLLLIGFFVNVFWSFQGKMLLPEGVQLKVPRDLHIINKGLFFDKPPESSVLLEKFTYGTQHFENGHSSVKPVADMLFSDEHGLERQQVRVNYPPSFGGLVWRYLNSGYSLYVSISSPEGVVVDDFINIATHNESSWSDKVSISKEQKLYINFYPDFVETAKHVYGSRSSFPNKPVIDLEFWEKDHNLGRVLEPLGDTRTVGKLSISFRSLRYWQLLDVSNDPGKYFISVGGIIIVFSLMWRVFFPTKIASFRVQAYDTGASTLEWGVRMNQGKTLFKQEIKQILCALEETTF